MLSRLPTERKVELQSINHADHRLPGTPGSMVPADGLPGTRRSSAASSTSSSRRSGGAQEPPGGVTESELEEDLRRLLSLMDDAEEAVEEQLRERELEPLTGTPGETVPSASQTARPSKSRSNDYVRRFVAC